MNDGWIPVDTFNSRPHEEVDRETLDYVDGVITFNSRPHEEVDDNQRDCGYDKRPFNSRPHEEVDSSDELHVTAFEAFQLTTSRRGRHYASGGDPVTEAFQLTTSRRGRR